MIRLKLNYLSGLEVNIICFTINHKHKLTYTYLSMSEGKTLNSLQEVPQTNFMKSKKNAF